LLRVKKNYSTTLVRYLKIGGVGGSGEDGWGKGGATKKGGGWERRA